MENAPDAMPVHANPLFSFDGSGFFGLFLIAFWIWMLVDCARNPMTRASWWILIVFAGNVFGAALYFVVHKLPTLEWEPPQFLSRFTRSGELQRARRDARNIGNAHQFCVLGEILRQTGQTGSAADAFLQALEKDPESLPALWGAGQTLDALGRHAEAKAHLSRVMQRDPKYRFGDAAHTYCDCLRKLGEFAAAREKLLSLPQLRHNPEARLLLARIHADENDAQAARAVLESVLQDIGASGGHRYRRLRWQTRRQLFFLGGK